VVELGIEPVIFMLQGKHSNQIGCHVLPPFLIRDSISPDLAKNRSFQFNSDLLTEDDSDFANVTSVTLDSVLPTQQSNFLSQIQGLMAVSSCSKL